MELGTAAVLLVNGLALSAILFLLSAGLTMIFGLLNVVNFAHGAFFMVGGYVAMATMRQLTGSLALGLLTGSLAVVVIGFAVERFLLRRFYEQSLESHLRQMLLTIGLSLVITETVLIFAGPQILAVPLSWGDESLVILGRNVPLYRVVLIGVGLVALFSLMFVMNRTRLGLIVRAGVQRADMVEAMGVDVYRMFTRMFLFGAALAGFAGAAAGPYYNAVYPQLGDNHLILAFGIVVVGGLGSLVGSAIASLIIGILIGFGAYVWPEGQSFFVMLMIIVILLIRPQGLFGAERTRV